MPKILYIEDEPSLAQIVSESLEKRGFEVFLSDNGLDIGRLMDQSSPDICVLDVMLPFKDGFEIGKEIKALHPEMPIIYLTAKSQTEDILQGFASGGNDYLRKPFSLEELIVRINNLLQMGSSNKVAFRHKIGTFSFNPQNFVLKSPSVEKTLSYRESLILLQLIESEMVERKKILEAVWGDDSYFNSRNLDVYITKLRNLFKEDPNVQIQTLKGVGYKLIC